MAKENNFVDTQTGGEGATPQVGDKPVESSEIKKEQGRPANLVKETEKKPTIPVGEQEQKPTEQKAAPEQKVDERRAIPLEADSGLVDEQPVEQDIPLVEQIEEDEEQVNQTGFGFAAFPDDKPLSDAPAPKFLSFGDDEPIDEAPDEKIVYPKEKLESEVKPEVKPEEKPKGEPEKIFKYPGTTRDYKVVDGYWYQREEGSKEWAKASRGTVFGLNDYHVKLGNITEAAKIPERTYFPPKGGVDFESIKVYGNPYQEGTVYTVQGDRWYKVDQGKKQWEKVDSDRTIKALNQYHGTSVKTESEIMRARAATQKPGTTEMFEKAERQPKSFSDFDKMLNEASRTEAPREKDIVERAGEVVDESGMPIGERLLDATIGAEEGQKAEIMYSTGTDVLFNKPPRPSDPIAAAQWDKEFGYPLPPTGEEVEAKIKKQQTLVEDRDKALEYQKGLYGEDSPQYEATANDFNKLIEESVSEIEKAEKGLEIQRESSRNNLEYRQSEQFEVDKKNSPYYKLAQIQEKMNNLSYGLYDEGYKKVEDERAKAYWETAILEDEINRDRLSNFTKQNIDDFYANTNLTDAQRSQIKMAQKRAQDILDKGALPGEAEKIVQETYAFMETTKDINNRLAEAYNRGMSLSDVFLENKKLFVERNKDILSPEVQEIFHSTLEMNDFLSDYIESGDVIIDPITNVYSISETADPYVRDYITKRLEDLMGQYGEVKGKIYSNNQKVIEQKYKELRSKEAAIAKIKNYVQSGEREYTDALRAKVSTLTEEITALKSEIRSLKNNRNTFFLNDPNAISLNTSSNATTSARQIYQSIPEGITPKQKFDLFYEQLRKRNNQLKEQYGISEGYLDRVGEKVRDILDWEGVADLSPQEIEFYKNEATLKQLAPIYVNNDWGITEESAGFWSAWDNAFTKTFAPNTASANGFFNETDQAATMRGVMAEWGMGEEDLAEGMTLSRLDDRIDVDFLSWETAGNMVGTSSAIMLALVGGGLATTGTLKLGAGMMRLLERADKLKDFASAAKDFQRVQKAFKTTMGKTRTGRYFYETGKQGAQFEISGMLFNMDEELNFMSGMGGAMAGKMFEGIFRNMTPSQLVKWMGGMFGTSTDKAVGVMKRFGESLKGVKAMNYRGLGEMPEEFAQELISIYKNELDGRGFWDVVNERYFEGEEGLSNLGELLVSSYVLGLGMGTVMSSSQNDMWNDLPPNERETVEQIIKDVSKDFSAAGANADISAGRIVDNYEALEAEEVAPEAEAKIEEDAVQKREAEKVDVDEEARPSEEVVEEAATEVEEKAPEEGVAEERVTAESLEQAIELFKQGYRPAEGDKINESASISEIENTWIKGRSVDMVKPAAETKVIPLSERIRAGKLDTGIAAVGIIPTSVINAAIEGVAVTVETVEGVINKIKNSDWYKNNPEKAKQADAELEQLRADLQNQAASQSPKNLGQVNDIVRDRITEEESTAVMEASSKSKKASDIAKKLGEPEIIETQDGFTLIYKETNEEGMLTGLKGVKVKRNKDGSISKRATVIDNDAALAEVEQSKKFLTPKRVKPTEAVKSIKERIAQFKRGFVSGKKTGKAETKEEAKAKKDAIAEIQQELLEYAKQVLPKTKYNKRDITSMMNKIRTAKNQTDLEKAMEAVDNQVAKFEEKVRQDTAARILKKLKDPQVKKGAVKGKKISKISLEARDALKAIIDEVGAENIPNMTQEELTDLEAKIDNITTEGKTEVKEQVKAEREEKRVIRETPFRVLATQNKVKMSKISGKYDIESALDSKQAAIMHDGQVFTSKTQFNEYLDNKGLTYESIGDVDEVTSRATTKDAIRKYEEALESFRNERSKEAKTALGKVSKGVWKYVNPFALTKMASRFTEAGATLDSRLMGVYRGSKELREWVKKNVIAPKEKAYRDRNNARQEKLQALSSEMQEIFGKRILTGVPQGWNDKSGVSIFDPSLNNELSNGQAVHVYMMLRSEPSTIYKVGDRMYNTEAKAEAAAKDTGQEIEEVTSEYNPTVLHQISEGKSLESGLEKAAEIEAFIEGNNDLKAASDVFKKFYNEILRGDYEGTFVDLYGQRFKEGYYYPLTRSIEQGIDTDILTNAQFNNASSAMSNHLKQRYNDVSPNAAFDFTTDAYSKILDYINTMEHAKHFLPVAEGFRNLMNPATKAQIIEKIGPKKALDLKRHMDVVLSDGKSEPITDDAVTNLARFTVVTTLAGKLASIPKQLTSMTHYWGAGLDWGVGTADVLAQSLKLPSALASGVASRVTKGPVQVPGLSDSDSKVINEIFKDAFTRERVTGRDIDIETRKIMNDLMNSQGKNLWKALQRAVLLPTTLGDVGGVLGGGIPLTLATYHHNKNNMNMSHEEALEDAMLKFISVSNKTQQSRRDDIVSLMQRDPQYRALMTYTTSQVAAMSEFMKGVRVLTDVKGGYTAKEYIRAGRKVGYYTMANSLFQIVSGGLIGMYLADEDDDERARELKKTALYNTVMDTFSSNLQGFGVPGKAADWFVNDLRGRKWFNNIPVIEKMYQGAEVGSEYTNVFLNATSLYMNGDIDGEQYFDLLYYSPSEKTTESRDKLIGLKNLTDSWEAWGQYTEADEDSKMTWWDAVMSRQIDEETGDVYVTGEEREDPFYEKASPYLEWMLGLPPSSSPSTTTPFPNAVDKKMQEAYEFENPEFKSDAEKLAEAMGKADPYGNKYTSKQKELVSEKGLQSKEEMLEFIRVKEKVEGAEETEEKRIEDLREGKIETMKEKREKEEKEEYEKWREEYKRNFGEYPPSDMTVGEISNAILSFEKQ
jgi:hypothetical protein